MTSPDLELNTGACIYFSRHMRLLEQCMSLCPMPEMQSKIDSLRNVFSADIRKPFILKPSFTYGFGVSTSSGFADDLLSIAPHSGRGRLASLDRGIFQLDQRRRGQASGGRFTTQPLIRLAPEAFPTSSNVSPAIGILQPGAYMPNVECGDFPKQMVDTTYFTENNRSGLDDCGDVQDVQGDLPAMMNGDNWNPSRIFEYVQSLHLFRPLLKSYLVSGTWLSAGCLQRQAWSASRIT